MNRCLDCIKIRYGCSLGISDDLINFWDESIKKNMAATAILKKIAMVVVGVIFLLSNIVITTSQKTPGQGKRR